MNRVTVAILLAVFGLADARPAAAIDLGLGILKRKSKGEPASRVKALAATLQSDPDEKKRLAAAEELRGFDPRANPDLMPALLGALQRDPDPRVRCEAAESIGKLKPVAQTAGIAMETALQSDPDPKVRDAIKAALWQYHLNGYRAPAGQAMATQSAEPPFAAPRPTSPPATQPRRASAPTTPEPGFRPIVNTVGKGVFYPPTTEPPLAPKPAPTAAPASTLPAPVLSNTVSDPARPTPMPSTLAPTVSVPSTAIPTTPLPPLTIPTVPSGPSIPVPLPANPGGS